MDDTCMLCHAHGEDKRTLVISCFYDLTEVAEEFVPVDEVESGYYLRICKSCRAALLHLLRDWCNERANRRGLVLDHDGYEKEE